MRARRMIFTAAMLAAWLSGGAPPLAAQDFAEVEIQATRLGGGLAMLVGRGGNIGVSVGDDGSFLIDDQFAPLTPKILAAVRELGGGEVRFVVNTHWHGDHTGGNEPLGRAGAVIVAHDKVRERMSTEQVQGLRGRTVPSSPPEALPVLTFASGVTLHLNGQEIDVVHLPAGHTDGDSLVHFRDANVMHTGDLFFNGFYPFIDVDSGGSIDGMIDAVDDALALANDETKIIPGHGPLATRADLVAYRAMLGSLRAAVQEQIDAGRSLEQAQAARPTRTLDDEWGDGFLQPDQIVAIVYASLRGAE